MTYVSRRDFLLGMGRAALLAGVFPASVAATNKANAGEKNRAGIGLALGAGGASGLAHIVVLEALEEMGLRPDCISGSSIGALIGGFIAAGHDSKAIRKLVAEMVPEDLGSWLGAVFKREQVTLLDLFKLDMAAGGLVDHALFSAFLQEHLGVDGFEDLDIPLAVTATDFWERERVVFDRGPLIPPIMASAALPGIFPPVEYQDRLLVDGGMVSPVPYDLVMDRVEITTAVDVTGTRERPEDGRPGYLDLVFNTFDIMQANMIRAMREKREPDIYLQPPVSGVRVLDFHKAEKIYEQAEPIKDELKRKLEKIYG